jgi:hypothetical protein
MNRINSTGDATDIARVEWVSPPNSGRGTWGIIWSCLAIFLICSWKCTHLNIPTIEESEAGCHKVLNIIPYFPKKSLLHKWSRKLLFMLIIVIGPEVVVALAANQFAQACQDEKNVNKGRYKKHKYTMAHAFFAQTGGFVVYFDEKKPSPEVENKASTDSQTNENTLVVKEASEADSEPANPTSKKASIPKEAQTLSQSQVGTSLY